MDLTTPLATLLSANEAAALKILGLTTAELTGRQVAKLADADASSIRRALLRQGRSRVAHADSFLSLDPRDGIRNILTEPGPRRKLRAPHRPIPKFQTILQE